MEWWAFISYAGMLHVKRLESKTEIEDAAFNPLIKTTFGPFMANSYDDAMKYARKKLQPEVHDGRSKRS